MSDMLKKMAEKKAKEKDTLSRLSGSSSELKSSEESPESSVPADSVDEQGEHTPINSKDALGGGGKKSGVSAKKSKRPAIKIESAGRTVEAYENLRCKSSTMDKLREIKRRTGKHFYEIVEELVDLVDLSEEE